jgi:hypothetical protein
MQILPLACVQILLFSLSSAEICLHKSTNKPVYLMPCRAADVIFSINPYNCSYPYEAEQTFVCINSTYNPVCIVLCRCHYRQNPGKICLNVAEQSFICINNTGNPVCTVPCRLPHIHIDLCEYSCLHNLAQTFASINNTDHPVCIVPCRCLHL